MKKFSLLLPPDWTLIDPADPASGVDEASAAMVRDRPADQRARAQAAVAAQLKALAAEFAGQGFAALALGVSPLDHRFSAPIVVVRPLDLPDEEDPVNLLVALAGSSPDAQLMEIDHLVGLRLRETDEMPTAEQSLDALPQGLREELSAHPDAEELVRREGPTMARRVRYLMGLPNDRERWVEIFASVQCPSDPDGVALADAFTETFDALASSFEWKD